MKLFTTDFTDLQTQMNFIIRIVENMYLYHVEVAIDREKLSEHFKSRFKNISKQIK